MNKQDFALKVADLIQIIDLYGDEFLDARDAYEVSDKLNEVLEILR